MTSLPLDELAEELSVPRVSRNVGPQRFWRRFVSNKRGLLGLILIGIMLVVGSFSRLLAPHSPSAISLTGRLASPTGSHWLGTDELGRDELSRMIYATATSLEAAALATAVAAVLGISLGMIGGYLGGVIDFLISRASDALMCFPPLILSIGIIAATGPGLRNAMIALGVVYAPRVLRVIRAATLGVRGETFIEAAVTTGTPTSRVIRKHVLPNIMSPLLVEVSILMSFAVLAEASLSFLGLGVVPPQASWGGLLSRAVEYERTAPLLIVWPGLAISLASIGFGALGDGLRDSLRGGMARR